MGVSPERELPASQRSVMGFASLDLCRTVGGVLTGRSVLASAQGTCVMHVLERT